MNSKRGARLALVAALREEISDLLREMKVEETYFDSKCSLYEGKYGQRDILLLQSGPGRERTEGAVAFLLDRFSVVPMLSIGFAGALSPATKVGDIILCRHLHYGNGNVSGCNANVSYSSDMGLVSFSREPLGLATGKILEGDSVTVGRVIGEPALKEKMGKTFSALAVDMESYWIARIASIKGIPFLAVRAISDSIDENLPPLERFTDSYLNLQRKKAMTYVFFHPVEIGRLVALRRHARQARKSLTAFVDLFLSHDVAG